MNRVVPVILLILLSGYFSSCSLLKHRGGTRKKHKSSDTVRVPIDSIRLATPDPKGPLAPDSIAKAEDTAMKQLIARITPFWTNRLTYKTFSAKARIHVETPDAGNDFAAHFRIRKDSVIWVSVNLAGIPVARVFVNRDSIFLLDYYHKEAKCVPLSQIAKILPAAVDFTSLQNLILGEPLCDGIITEAADMGDSVMIWVEDTSYLQRIIYNKKDSAMHHEQLTTRQVNGPIANSEYSNYEMLGNRRLSTNRVLHVENNNALYILEMNFTKWEFDDQLEYPFSIPKNYR